jgi:hypothetical protein
MQEFGRLPWFHNPISVCFILFIPIGTHPIKR